MIAAAKARARKAAMEETEDASSHSDTDVAAADAFVLVGSEEQDMVTLQPWCLCALILCMPRWSRLRKQALHADSISIK